MMLPELFDNPALSNVEITGLAADSRKVRPGFLFAALKGEGVDGAQFIPQAVEAGAAAILAAPDVAAPVPLVVQANPRRALALAASKFYGAQPDVIAAVTGTNGKTSVVSFLQRIWSLRGRAAASLGTLGVRGPGYERTLAHTTPEPIELHEILAEIAARSVACHLAMEASSHGLAQHRLDGVRLSAAAFTNITQDHLDYHGDFNAYLEAKLRLMTELLPDDGVAVVNADGAGADQIIERLRADGRAPFTVGRAGADLRLIECAPHADGQRLRVAFAGEEVEIDLPLAGAFQAENALVAAGVAMALDGGAEAPDRARKSLLALSELEPVRGRLELVGRTNSGAAVYVDYAHTPDALERALQALRPHTRSRLHVVFGAGGDRDRAKRPLMGKAAQTYADQLIVTDDNPRTEDPTAIRADILTGCAGAAEFGDRADAIRAGIAALGDGDVLVIAGKGHETGQIVGDRILPFDDREVARAALNGEGGA